MKNRIFIVLKFSLIIVSVFCVWPFIVFIWPLMGIRWVITGKLEEDVIFFPLPQLAKWV